MIGLLLYCYWMRKITIVKVATYMASGGSTGIASLVPFSIAIQALTIVILAWAGASFLCSPKLHRSLSIRGLVLCICTIAASYLAMKLVINFSAGFKGPPLIKNLMLQAVGAPFKPWVSHFLYFGLVVPLVAAQCIRWCFRGDTNMPVGLLFIVISFLPFLCFGSESRQWIGVLPACVVIYALTENTRRQQVFLSWHQLRHCLPCSAFKPTLQLQYKMNWDFRVLNGNTILGGKGLGCPLMYISSA